MTAKKLSADRIPKAAESRRGIAQYPFFRNAIRANQSVQCFVIDSTAQGAQTITRKFRNGFANSPDRMPRSNSTRKSINEADAINEDAG